MQTAQDKLKSTGQQLAQAQGRDEAARPSARPSGRRERAREAPATGTPALGAAGMGCGTFLYDGRLRLKAFVTLFKRAATEKEPGKEAQVCPRSFCGEQGLPRIFNSWVHRSLLETQLKNVIMKNQKLSFLQPRNSGLCCSKVLNAVRGFTGFFDACSSSHTHFEALPATGLGQAATCSRTASCRILRTLTA